MAIAGGGTPQAPEDRLAYIDRQLALARIRLVELPMADRLDCLAVIDRLLDTRVALTRVDAGK